MTAHPHFTALVILAALSAPLPVLAALPSTPSASLEYGSGSKVELLRVGIQSNWEKQWFHHNGRHLGAYWDLMLGQLRGHAYQGIAGQHQNISDIGLTPVFRWETDERKGWYLEGGIGMHLLSQLYDNDANHLSTHFQFGDHLGGGYVLANGWDLGLKLQHFSNAGIKEPNSGVNFVVVKVGHTF